MPACMAGEIVASSKRKQSLHFWIVVGYMSTLVKPENTELCAYLLYVQLHLLLSLCMHAYLPSIRVVIGVFAFP